jgi:hypothetical protein
MRLNCVVDLSILTHYAEELVKFLFLDVQDHMGKTSKLKRLRPVEKMSTYQKEKVEAVNG